jgi:site-specific DNA-methyltransferase (adenine-specific)
MASRDNDEGDLMILYHGDCLEFMHTLEPGSVDAIITDLPYGTTACKWDTVIPFVPMWKAVKHVLKPDGAFITTASQPFTSLLVCSNLQWFKYEWIWEKEQGTNQMLKNIQPLRSHEDIIVFCNKTPDYFPQFEQGYKSWKTKDTGDTIYEALQYKGKKQTRISNGCLRFPKTILKFFRPLKNRLHPTQKPVALYKYLIKTYTNEGDTVLDMCMGSGTTGIACVETGRDFIGCETEEEHFQTAQSRISQATKQPDLFVKKPQEYVQTDLMEAIC